MGRGVVPNAGKAGFVYGLKGLHGFNDKIFK